MLFRTGLIFALLIAGVYALLFSITSTPFVKNKARAKRFAKHFALVLTAIVVVWVAMAFIFNLEQL